MISRNSFKEKKRYLKISHLKKNWGIVLRNVIYLYFGFEYLMRKFGEYLYLILKIKKSNLYS